MSTSILLKTMLLEYPILISYLVNFLIIKYKTRKQPTLGLLYSPVLLDMINICVDVFQYAFGESWLGLPWLRGMCDQVLNEFLFLTFIYLTLLWVRRNRRHSHLQRHSSQWIHIFDAYLIPTVGYEVNLDMFNHKDTVIVYIYLSTVGFIWK